MGPLGSAPVKSERPRESQPGWVWVWIQGLGYSLSAQAVRPFPCLVCPLAPLPCFSLPQATLHRSLPCSLSLSHASHSRLTHIHPCGPRIWRVSLVPPPKNLESLLTAYLQKSQAVSRGLCQPIEKVGLHSEFKTKTKPRMPKTARMVFLCLSF